MYRALKIPMTAPPEAPSIAMEERIFDLLRRGPEPAHWLRVDADPSRYYRSTAATLQWRDAAKVPRQVCQTTGTTAPLPGTGLNGHPSIEWVGTSGVLLRAPTAEDMRVNTEACTVIFVGKPTHTGGNLWCGYTLGASATASDYTMVFGFTGSGSQQAFRLWNGNLSVERISSVRNVIGETHVFTLGLDKVNGIRFFIDRQLDRANPDDLNGLTDGRFQIGGVGSGVSSILCRGSMGDMIFFNENLTLPERADYLQDWIDLLIELNGI